MKEALFILLMYIIFFFGACRQDSGNGESIDMAFDKISNDSLFIKNEKEDVMTAADTHMQKSGLVDVQNMDTSIRVNLRYSSTDNFLSRDMYGDLSRAYLQPEVARKLANAASLLREKAPHLRLCVWDAVRPVSVQQMMWDSVDAPANRKHWYVTPPGKSSLHNFGAAVDVTLKDSNGTSLDMGTDFDHFGKAAYTTDEDRLQEEGVISEAALKNRRLLRQIMGNAGFTSIKYEWWHFNSCSRNVAKSKYPLIFELTESESTSE